MFDERSMATEFGELHTLPRGQENREPVDHPGVITGCAAARQATEMKEAAVTSIASDCSWRRDAWLRVRRGRGRTRILGRICSSGTHRHTEETTYCVNTQEHSHTWRRGAVQMKEEAEKEQEAIKSPSQLLPPLPRQQCARIYTNRSCIA